MSFSTTCEDINFKVHRKFNTLHTSPTDPMITTKPIETRNHGQQFSQHFQHYLKGDLNLQHLIQTLNYPRLNEIKTSNLKRKMTLKTTQQSEQRKNFLKGKLNNMKQLINEKVIIKKPHNDELRQGNAQNLTIVQTILDIANFKQSEGKLQEKLLPKTKNLKGFRLNYDNVEPINHLQQNIINNIPPRTYMKTVMENNAQLYLQELQSESEQKDQRLNRLVKFSIQNKKKDFTLFHKAAKTDRRNQDGILTYADVQLYDYLFNKPKEIKIEKNPKYIQNVIDSEIDFRKQFGRKLNSRNCKQTHLVHYNRDPPCNSDDSCSSSLQSAFEIKLDNYYSETREWKKKAYLQLPRRIKQLIALEDLNLKAIHTTMNKLEQQ